MVSLSANSFLCFGVLTMASFDDQLDELGEDFGIINTPGFVKHKWGELRIQWDNLIRPYAEIGSGTITPPNYLKTQYAVWKRAYENNADSWLPWTSSITIWKDEAQRYSRVYKFLENLRSTYLRTTNPDPARTPSPADSGAAPPAEIYNPTTEGSGSSSGDHSLFAGINWNIGTIAVVSIMGLFAYNIFFRLREGHKGK
jgi:hypothetical protein